MTAEVCLSPILVDQFDMRGKNVVIIDIFRATSCMVTGLCNEVDRIYPVASVEECLRLGGEGMIMAGERGGQKIEEFDIGNSPFDYLSEQVRSRRVAVTTTNGTQAINKSEDAYQIIIGAFLNLAATVNYLVRQDLDVILHCAGWKGTINLEDTLFAGAVLDSLGDRVQLKDDACQLARSLYRDHQDNLLGIAKQSGHAARLAKFGITRDIEFCMTQNTYDEVVVMRENYLSKL
ncbi:MAG: 2-phosphosulfolactate phosphatase [Bacteroidota bacterium]